MSILQLELSVTEEQTLAAAAKAAHQPLSQFVLESALACAEATLPDRRHFVLDAGQWEAFTAALDAPPRDIPKLRELFARQPIWDRD